MKFEAIEEKRIYLHAEAVGDEIWNLAVGWPHFVQHSVGLQLVRAADSVGANIAEGMGRYHPKDVCKFLYYARGSLRETVFWLRRAQSRQLIDESTAQNLYTQLDTLARELNKSINFQKTRPTQTT